VAVAIADEIRRRGHTPGPRPIERPRPPERTRPGERTLPIEINLKP
jgi:hypothetical protein